MIIFDLDGTLWDTIEATFIAANKIANQYEEIKNIEMKTIVAIMGLSFKEVAQKYMPYLDKEKREKYLEEMEENRIEIIKKSGAKIYDNVIEVIKELSKTYKLGIVTNSSDDYVESFFEFSKLKDFFQDYIGTATYNISKAEAIKLMVKRNETDDNCYVGDIKKDMLASEEANVTFIHAKYGFGKDLKANLFIDDINELPKIIKTIFK